VTGRLQHRDDTQLELCVDVIVSAAALRSILAGEKIGVGGGAELAAKNLSKRFPKNIVLYSKFSKDLFGTILLVHRI